MSTAGTKGLMSYKKGVAESTMACQRKCVWGCLTDWIEYVWLERRERMCKVSGRQTGGTGHDVWGEWWFRGPS